MVTPRFFIALAALLWVGSAYADEVDDVARAAARELAKEGGQLYLDGDYAGAADKLGRAHAIVRLPTVSFWLARSKQELGHWVEAAELYREVALLPTPDVARPVHEKAKADAAAALEALEPRIPHLQLVVTGVPLDTVEVSIDDRTIPSAALATKLAIDPGSRRVVVRQGEVETVRTVVAVEGETTDLRVELEPVVAAPPPPPPPPAPPAPRPVDRPESDGSAWPIVGTTSLAIGGAGAVLAAVAGGLLLSGDADLDDRCVELQCTSDAAEDIDALAPLRPLTTVGIAVGAVGLAAGVTILLVAPEDDGSAEVALSLHPTGWGVRGRF